MAKFKIITPAGASFTTSTGYDLEMEALEGLEAGRKNGSEGR